MYAHLKSATELQLIIAVLSLFHMFAPDIVSVLWNNCVRARGTVESSAYMSTDALTFRGISFMNMMNYIRTKGLSMTQTTIEGLPCLVV